MRNQTFHLQRTQSSKIVRCMRPFASDNINKMRIESMRWKSPYKASITSQGGDRRSWLEISKGVPRSSIRRVTITAPQGTSLPSRARWEAQLYNQRFRTLSQASTQQSKHSLAIILPIGCITVFHYLFRFLVVLVATRGCVPLVTNGAVNIFRVP